MEHDELLARVMAAHNRACMGEEELRVALLREFDAHGAALDEAAMQRERAMDERDRAERLARELEECQAQLTEARARRLQLAQGAQDALAEQERRQASQEETLRRQMEAESARARAAEREARTVRQQLQAERERQAVQAAGVAQSAAEVERVLTENGVLRQREAQAKMALREAQMELGRLQGLHGTRQITELRAAAQASEDDAADLALELRDALALAKAANTVLAVQPVAPDAAWAFEQTRLKARVNALLRRLTYAREHAGADPEVIRQQQTTIEQLRAREDKLVARAQRVYQDLLTRCREREAAHAREVASLGDELERLRGLTQGHGGG